MSGAAGGGGGGGQSPTGPASMSHLLQALVAVFILFFVLSRAVYIDFFAKPIIIGCWKPVLMYQFNNCLTVYLCCWVAMPSLSLAGDN